MNVKIRKLKSEELDLAAQIFYASFNSVGEKWNLETCLKRLKQHFNEQSCWAAEIEHEMVGILIAEEDNVLDGQELYIDIIAVKPDFIKAGVGSKLLETAETYAQEQNYNATWLTASNKLPSFNWYQKTGYRETSWKTLVKPLK